MTRISYDQIIKQEGRVLNANGLRFSPFDDKPYHMSINPEHVVGNEIYRVLKAKRQELRPVTGQTRLYRYPALFGAALRCIQSARPDKQKTILSAPSSIGAEAVSLAAKVRNMNLLGDYKFECVDICAEYIRHAKTMQFPAGMLIRRDSWLQDAFQISSNPPSKHGLWVEPIPEIQDAITTHEPQDMATFASDKKYDIIFMMTLFTHLTKSQQSAVLENMMIQCNGLLCFDASAPRMSDDQYACSEKFSDTLQRIRGTLTREGYVFCAPHETNIKIQDLSDGFYAAQTGGSVMQNPNLSGAIIAIHPDLAAEMS